MEYDLVDSSVAVGRSSAMGFLASVADPLTSCSTRRSVAWMTRWWLFGIVVTLARTLKTVGNNGGSTRERSTLRQPTVRKSTLAARGGKSRPTKQVAEQAGGRTGGRAGLGSLGPMAARPASHQNNYPARQPARRPAREAAAASPMEDCCLPWFADRKLLH